MTRRVALAAAVSMALAAAWVGPRAHAAILTPLANADGWAAQPPGRERDKILLGWTAGAKLPELMWVMRHGPPQLGAAELPMIERALEQTPPARSALRRRLLARLVTLDLKRAKKRVALGDLLNAPLAPSASVFRVALMVPEDGAYADYAASLRAGLETGLAAEGAALPADVQVWNTGEDDPARAIAALDTALRSAGAVVGELLSTPTEILAAGARPYGTPLISPTATEEAVGAMGPHVYQVGPSGVSRARRLAAAMDLAGHRVGLLTSSASSPSFGAGFAVAALEARAEVVSRATYAHGATSFRIEVRDLVAKKVDVLLWDGEPREADALLRQLAKDRVSMRICGSSALAPESHHAEMHFLLEGVRYVADEWSLPRVLEATLDAASRERTGQEAGPVFVRGWLVGRVLRAGLDAGALAPEELAAELDKRRMRGAYLESHGFLEPGLPGFELPVFTVSRGKAVAVGE